MGSNPSVPTIIPLWWNLVDTPASKSGAEICVPVQSRLAGLRVLALSDSGPVRQVLSLDTRVRIPKGLLLGRGVMVAPGTLNPRVLVRVQAAQLLPGVVELVDTPDLGSGAAFAYGV